MDRTCGDGNHVLLRYVVYKGEKNIQKQFTDKDICQFCKEQLGGGIFYCKSLFDFGVFLSQIVLLVFFANLFLRHRLWKMRQGLLRPLRVLLPEGRRLQGSYAQFGEMYASGAWQDAEGVFEGYVFGEREGASERVLERQEGYDKQASQVTEVVEAVNHLPPRGRAGTG